MGLALSTSWNAFRYSGGASLIREIKSLGFKEVELSFNLTSSMFEDIAKLVEKRFIQVTSLHNYCPIPRGLERVKALPDYYSLASTDEPQRKKAVQETKRTIDSAARLRAKAVVLHCGRVEIPDQTRELIGLYSRGLNAAAEFQDFKEKVIRKRKANAGPFLESALRSLGELSGYALNKKIKLGVETRFYYREIPCFEEIGIILGKFRDSGLFYWHDTGHAEVMARLGLATHRGFLDSYSADLLGVHLHNIRGCFDHQAPVKGEFDFKVLKKYLKKETIKVIEAHHPATPEDLRKSKAYLESLFHGKV